jgi:hypothetical protein
MAILDAARMKLFRQFITCVISALLSASVLAGPMAYSINSDSGSADADSLYKIDLLTGAQTKTGKVLSITEVRRDTEGLAMSPENVLYGVDDESLSLFPISMSTGSVDFSNEVQIKGDGLSPGGHDFGLTFTCSGELYITSLVTESLYRLELNGATTLIGPLGAKVSSIASYGLSDKLYGLGNGEDDGGDVRKFYEIDINTGNATIIGSLGGVPGQYTESGLAFDESGDLWAITDRRVINNSVADLPSQILSIDIGTGAAIVVSETTEVGFESLAIAAPSGCSVAPPPRPNDYDKEAEAVPTLGFLGLLFSSLALLLTGLLSLRRFNRA